MSNTQFWRLAPPDDTRHLVSWDEGMSFGDAIRCPLYPDHQRAGPRIGNLQVVLPSRSLPDILWTWMSECLVSDEVLSLLRKEKITGFDVRPVESRVRGSENPGPVLWELVVTGWGGVAPPSSGVQRDPDRSCLACGHVVYTTFTRPTHLLDESLWDGSDLFLVWPLPRLILATRKVERLVRSHGLSGADLVPLNELRSTSDALTPGPLAAWFPARQEEGL